MQFNAINGLDLACTTANIGKDIAGPLLRVLFGTVKLPETEVLYHESSLSGKRSFLQATDNDRDEPKGIVLLLIYFDHSGRTADRLNKSHYSNVSRMNSVTRSKLY